MVDTLDYNPVEFTFVHTGGTWKITILLGLKKDPVRYTDLNNVMPSITDKMLHTHSREKESKKMISRQVFRKKPMESGMH